jgi:hypothetical protein
MVLAGSVAVDPVVRGMPSGDELSELLALAGVKAEAIRAS